MANCIYMSVLSTFADAEISAGVYEIADAHPEPVLRSPDDFVFIIGRKPR